jgi:hypothetical protein
MSFKPPSEEELRERRYLGIGLLFLSNDQETQCLERPEQGGGSEVMYHLSGKLFSQIHVAKQCSAS